MKKRGKRAILLSIFTCLFLLLSVPAAADEVDNVNAVRNGVLAVNLVYVDDAGNGHLLQGGSGFLINEQNLITNQHVVSMDSATKEAANEEFGVDFNDSKVNVEIQVVVQRDVVVESTVTTSSEAMDFAILELSDPIYDRNPLTLGDSDNVGEAQTVYALGFPSRDQWTQDFSYFTSSDVSVTNGIVSKKQQTNGVPTIKHSATLAAGNSGGPLVNAEGEVIGVNFGTVTDNQSAGGDYFAVEINEIKGVLDAMGVIYNEGGAAPEITAAPEQDPAVTETPEEEPEQDPVDKSALESAIAEAEAVDASSYTTQSYGLLEEQLDKAKNVNADANASQESVDSAAEQLSEAISGLEENQGLGIWLWVIIGAAAIIVIVIIIIVAVSISGKKKKAPVSGGPYSGGPAIAPGPSGARPQQGPGVVPPAGMHHEMPPQPQPYRPAPQPADIGAGETTLLNEGAGETTLLGASAAGAAFLIRKKNREKVSITGQSFTMGKERSRVNYCVSGNTSVSRCHARITRKGAQYFISDMNSTNFTYVNNSKLMPGQEVMLNNNDVIRLADEEFEFHLG